MPASSGQRLDVVDALRGFAALAVVFYHVWNVIFPWGNTQTGPVLADPNHPWFSEGWAYHVTFFLFQYGYFGVTIFFVISGFCIHLPQARRRARTGDDGLKLEPFFLRRFWRLYPAYFAALLVASLAVAVMGYMELRGKGLTFAAGQYGEAFGVSEVCVNALFLLPFFPAAKGLNGVLWTLVFEVQFYLLYPVLLWGMRRLGLATVGMALLTAEVLLAPGPKTRETFYDHNPWEYFFLARYFEWYLGVVAAELYVRRGSILTPGCGRVGLALGVAASIASTFLPALWPHRDLFVSATTVCVLSMLLRRPAVAHGPGLRCFAWVGLFSYSLYLLHYPLLRLSHAGTRLVVEAFGGSLDASAPMYHLIPWVPVVIAVSYGFYWLFERPFLHATPGRTRPASRVEPVAWPTSPVSATPARGPGQTVVPQV